MSWQQNLKDSLDDLTQLVREARTIAVLGIKTEAQADQPAYYVPAYMASAGYDIIPVPVFYPEATEILGRPVYRRLADIGRPIDIVNVFRRPESIMAHLDDILASQPRCVWLQSGIRHAEAAEILARAGIVVVQDACLMVVARQLGAAGSRP
jgi:uncharacterized protein